MQNDIKTIHNLPPVQRLARTGRRFYRVAALALTVLSMACDPSAIFEEGAGDPVAATDQYEKVIQPIFDANCVFCHGPLRKDFGIDLASYSAVMAGDKNGDAIVVPFDRASSSLHRSVYNGFMPIGIAPLLQTEIDAIGDWIDAGAPGPLSEPTEPTAAPSDFYASKVQPIFDVACIACHGTLKQDFGINLASYAALMTGDKNGDPLVVPYDAEASSLHRSVANNFMPIGVTPLSQTDKDTLAQWINMGAPAPLSDPAPAPVEPTDEYYSVIQPIFDVNCVFCHGDTRQDFGINLASYEALMAGDKNGDPLIVPYNAPASSLHRSVYNGFMPIGIAPLLQADVDAIANWINAGAPGPDGEPVLPPAVERSSYYVKNVQPIFDAACISCHGDTRQDFGINLASYYTTITGDAYGNPTVVAFRRYGSSLYRSVVTPFMPIGPTPLTPAQVEKIGVWIDMGLPAPAPYLSARALAAATDSVPYSYSLASIGGAGSVTYALASGTVLPAGLSLSAQGVLSGTPVAAAQDDAYVIKLVLTDSEGVVGTDTATLMVYSAIPDIMTLVLPSADEGLAYDKTLEATGGLEPYTWTVIAGSLPAGLSLSSDGQLTGTPGSGTGNQDFTFTVQVEESIANETATKQYTLHVNPPHVYSFSNEVYSRIDDECQGCHSDASPLGGLSLEGTASVVRTNLVVGGFVVAGDPTQGSLMNRLDRAAGTSGAMPGLTQLSEGDRNIIRNWILQGAQNN